MDTLTRILATFFGLWLASAAFADPLMNTTRFGVDMRAGPGFQFPLIHVLDPGEVADRGRCDLDGRWCLLTARDKVGWVDTVGLVPPRSGLAQSDPISPITTAPVTSSTIDDTLSTTPTAPRPLPDAILDAVKGRGGTTASELPAGARIPAIFATDAPFYNVTEGLVNLRAGPGTDAAILSELRPGDGGLIDICDAAQRWCRMRLDDGSQGWVKMTLVGVRRIDIAPLAER